MRWLALLALFPALAGANPRADELAEQALARYQADELISARSLADESLAIDPEQYRAHYVLGMVQRESEGNLAQSMYHLGESRRSYETRYATSLDTDWRFHRQLLYMVQVVAGEIEAFEYQLELIDFYNARYDPDLIAERAWPLMKLGRPRLARHAAEEAVGSDDEWQQSLGLNALCALESEAGDREGSYQACVAALEAERRSPNADVTVDAYNASLAAYEALHYEVGEELALEANTGSTASTANPFAVLAMAYISQGRGEEAAGALSQMLSLRAALEPELRDMNRADQDAVFALVMLAAGEPELGYPIITRAIDFPDRRAMTSGSADQARGGHALLRIALRRALDERQREKTSTEGAWGRLTATFGGLLPDSVAWQDHGAVTAVLADSVTMDRTLRLYLDGGLDVCPPWMLGELIDVLGRGVFAEALDAARAAEASPGMVPFYDALEAELAWHRGDYDRVRELARSVEADLPAQEFLLLARVKALAADAARRQGEMSAALPLYQEVMETDPGVLRRLGLSLPATVRSTSTSAAGQAAEAMLARSPRLRSTAGGFVVSVGESRDALEVCLAGPSGGSFGCVIEPVPPRGEDGTAVVWTDWERAQHAVDAFHYDTFRLDLGRTTRQLAGMDAAAASSTQTARESMSGLLERLTAPGGSETP